MLNKTYLLLLAVFALFASIFIAAAVNAKIESGSYFDLTLLSYEASQPLKGFVNLGLSSENADSLVKASIDGAEQSISLLEFLENANANFTCQPSDCLSYYTASGTTGQLVVMPGTELFGFKIAEKKDVTKIERLSFDISNVEDFQKTCGEVPIRIDLLDDGTIDWQYLEAGDYCGNFSTSECYKGYIEGGNEFNIGHNAYCQKKFLQVTSRLKLGAMVRKREGITESGDLKMYIHDPDTLKNSADCDLPEPSSSEFSLQSCELNFTIKKSKDYYICIIDQTATGYPYAIRGEKSYPMCGYAGKPEDKEAVADFELYAQIAEIAPFSGTVTFNEGEFEKASESFSESNSLLDYIDDYLYERYDYNCSDKCIIPIKAEVKSRTLISSIILDITSGGVSEPIDVLNSLTKKPALVDMASTRLDFNVSGFIAPEQHGDYNMLLKVGSTTLNPVSGIKFSVAAIPQIHSVFPLSAFAGFETTFSVSASSPVGNKIVSYNWNFGDGAVETTANATVKHAYPKIGNYNLTIKAEDEKGIIGKATFIIEAKAPKEAVSIMLAKKRLDLDQFSTQLAALPEWLQEIVKESYNIDELSIGLKKCEEDFKTVTKEKDEKYVAIKEDLDRLLIPSKLEDSIIIEEFSAIMRIDSIDPNYIKNLGGGSFESSLLSETKNAIAFWQSENLDIKISGLVKTAKVDSIDKDIFTLLHLTLTPKKPLGRFYFVIVLPPGIDSSDARFAEKYKEYSKGKTDRALGFRFSELTATKGIDLALPGKQDFLSLSMFASPNLDELEVVELTACGNTICEPKLGENYKNCPEDCKPTKKVITYLLLVILLSAAGVFLIWRFYAAIYDLMQQKKLFKTKKDYIDMLIFISSATKKGQTEEEITKKLTKAGWNKEQIEYAMLKAMKARKKIRKEQEKKST